MRRKYDIRNKRTFIIILILSIAIIGIFSLFIYKYKHAEKIEYTVSTGSIIQDNNKNYIETSEDGILKVRWNGSYYLVYQDKKISLGKKVIVYDSISESIKLYGKFYEITESGKIIDHSTETVLKNASNTKFYKLDDREYLLVDKEITSNDKSINASNYLLVELDRMGNAKLSNYKLNLKTIKPTTLITSEYSFDIANEILKYESLDIDLKKIIGTSNQYKEEEKKNEDDKTDSNTINKSINNQVVANGAGNSSTVVNNTNQSGQYVSLEELKKNVKLTSIVRAYEGLTTIDVDYVVYDPYKEYKDLYAVICEVYRDNKDICVGGSEEIEMSKYDTHMIFEGLKADTPYKITFYYTTIDSETNESKRTSFGVLDMQTKKPQYGIGVYKISKIENRVYFKIYLQEEYKIDSLNVTLSFECPNCNERGYESIPKEIIVDGNSNVILDNISISGYEISGNTLLRLDINSVSGANGTINTDAYTTFRIGR